MQREAWPASAVASLMRDEDNRWLATRPVSSCQSIVYSAQSRSLASDHAMPAVVIKVNSTPRIRRRQVLTMRCDNGDASAVRLPLTALSVRRRRHRCDGDLHWRLLAKPADIRRWRQRTLFDFGFPQGSCPIRLLPLASGSCVTTLAFRLVEDCQLEAAVPLRCRSPGCRRLTFGFHEWQPGRRQRQPGPDYGEGRTPFFDRLPTRRTRVAGLPVPLLQRCGGGPGVFSLPVTALPAHRAAIVGCPAVLLVTIDSLPATQFAASSALLIRSVDLRLECSRRRVGRLIAGHRRRQRSTGAVEAGSERIAGCTHHRLLQACMQPIGKVFAL